MSATDAAIGRAVLDLVAAELQYIDECARREDAARDALRTAGHRIVTHRTWNREHGGRDWQVLDAATGEVLAAGRDNDDTDDGIDAAWQVDWFHEDRVGDLALPVAHPDLPGLPDGIVGALCCWVMEDPDAARRALDELGAR